MFARPRLEAWLKKTCDASVSLMAARGSVKQLIGIAIGIINLHQMVK